MYELNKEKIGKFIAELRKEQGMTQKELAEKLKVSDKTISKWETGGGMPDVSMLMPMAEVFHVTVTELLQGQRMPQTEKLDVTQVDALLKQTLQLTEAEKQELKVNRKKYAVTFSICMLMCCIEIALLFWLGEGWSGLGVTLPTMILLAAIFGLYFAFFAKTKLPAYYDDNKINFYTDGFMRMNIPGVHFNNRNWPHILKAAQMGTSAILVLYPLFRLVIVLIADKTQPLETQLGLQMIELVVGLALFFGLLFGPMIVAARKYE